jgi:fructose/tagatose bisphosphate aldolase
MLTLREALAQAQKNHTAVGHFNVSDLTLLKAVFCAARGLKVAAVVGVSEGEREFTGTRQIAALVRSLREEFDFPIFLNADHTHSLEKALEAARAGFDLRKHLDIARIAQIKSAARIPLTLHGGSGTADDDLRKAIAAGISLVHINTELRVAWRGGLEDGLTQHPHELAPYKILPTAVKAVEQVVHARMSLFSGG